jgi:uncharacterized protein YjbI with pentapeptide repeats
VNLTWANLDRANLAGACLVKANLAGASLTAANLTNALADKATRWPKGFDPVTAGVTCE